MARKQVLVRSEFRDWLETLPADHKFTQCDGRLCPLAQYLNDAVGLNDVRVGAFDYGGPGCRGGVKLPTWAVHFVLNFDRYYVDEDWDQKNRDRNAAIAREVLNAIPETE